MACILMFTSFAASAHHALVAEVTDKDNYLVWVWKQFRISYNIYDVIFIWNMIYMNFRSLKKIKIF